MSDAIDRQAVIDALAKFVPYAICDESTESYTNGLTDAYNLILQLPSAQPERKKGKWNERKVFDTEGSDIEEMQSAKCSVCGKYHTTPYLYFFDNFNYCPNCGARMEQT